MIYLLRESETEGVREKYTIYIYIPGIYILYIYI